MARSGRTGKDPWQTAEAAFKAVTEKAPEPAPRAAPVIPNAREQVTLRLDRDVLEHFQARAMRSISACVISATFFRNSWWP